MSPRQESNAGPPEHWAGVLYYLPLLMMTSAALILAVCRTPVTYELSYNDLALYEFAQLSGLIESPPDILEVIGSIPVGDSRFFSLPRARVM